MNEVREASLELKKPEENVVKSQKKELKPKPDEERPRRIKQEATDELEEELLNEEGPESDSEETTIVSETDESFRSDPSSRGEDEKMETE